jgi:hypothetical protein
LEPELVVDYGIIKAVSSLLCRIAVDGPCHIPHLEDKGHDDIFGQLSEAQAVDNGAVHIYDISTFGWRSECQRVLGVHWTGKSGDSSTLRPSFIYGEFRNG